MAWCYLLITLLTMPSCSAAPEEVRNRGAPRVLTAAQLESFWREGFLAVENSVSAELLARLRADTQEWVDESRKHTEPFGTMLHGKPRFDIETNHTAANPRLRRVGSPTEISSAYLEVLTDSQIPRMVADIIGPDLRLHHSKLNPKLPHTATEIDWHQEFTFDPHSNDDQVLALLFLDDVTEENGPPAVVPGSHRGPLVSLWQNGKFTGRVGAAEKHLANANAVSLTGPAGSLMLVHTRTLHSSKANTCDRSRNVFVSLIAAADAVPLARNEVPSIHSGIILHGQEPGKIRSTPFVMDAPGKVSGVAFFSNQEEGTIVNAARDASQTV